MKVTNTAPPNPQIIERAKAAEKPKVADKAIVETEKKDVQVRGSVVNISEDAQLMRKAAEIVNSIPDVRGEKVAALKKLVQEGKYQADSGAVADRLLQEHLSTDFGKNNI